MGTAHDVPKTGPGRTMSDLVAKWFLPETVLWLAIVLLLKRSSIPTF
jgi:hypothetical protein